MMADMKANEKLSPIVLRGRKVNISLIFISQFYSKETKCNTLFYYEKT